MKLTGKMRRIFDMTTFRRNEMKCMLARRGVAPTDRPAARCTAMPLLLATLQLPPPLLRMKVHVRVKVSKT